MPSPLELYREWERTGSLTRVHVMQIDRGDNSAANRLTLTDRPYVDKGVSGSKYHDTYPAPIQAIESDLITDESFSGTQIDDIVLLNGDGQFDDLLRTGANIIGHRFTVLRGDQTWSLMETDYPYRFVEIFRGQISGVSVDRGRVVLSCVAVKYKLDNTIGSIDAPIHYGGAHRNLPALLVDEATHRYRFSTKTASHASSDFRPRDNGLPPSGYTEIAEGEPTNRFLTLIELDSEPIGQLTADLFTGFLKGFSAARQACVENLVSSYPAIQASFDYDSDSDGPTCFGNSDAEFYYIDASADRIRQRTMSTPGDVTTLGSSTKSVAVFTSSAFGTYRALQAVSADLFVYCDGTYVKERDMSGWDISGSTFGNNFDTTSVLGGPELCYGFAVIPSKGLLYLLHRDGIVYRLTYTPGDISTATGAEVVLRLQPFTSETTDWFYDMVFSPDGRYCYFAHQIESVIIQYACIGAYELEGSFRSGRSYFDNVFARYGKPSFNRFHMGVSGNKFYISRGQIGSPAEINQFDGIENYLLPTSLIETSISTDHLSYSIGVFYNREVQIGAILSDIFSSIGADYTVSKNGALFAMRLEDPNATLSDWVTVYDIDLSAFRGWTGEHIRHVSTKSAKREITVRYDVNFTVQNESTLAGAVSLSNKSYWSRPYETVTVTNSLTNYVDPEDLIAETFLSSETQAESVRDYVAGLWGEDRQEYEWTTDLYWQTLLSGFGLGSIINVAGDIKHPEFAEDDRVQVIGRRVNWSKDQQDLRVFR